jgi:hypothetical protein
MFSRTLFLALSSSILAWLLIQCDISARTMEPVLSGDISSLDKLAPCVPTAPAGYWKGTRRDLFWHRPGSVSKSQGSLSGLPLS